MMSGDSPTHARPGSTAAGGMGPRSSAQASMREGSPGEEAP
jgi:hypothetical protein